MKVKRIIVIISSIIVPIVITILVGLYSYGIIGDWEENQSNFVDHIFNQCKTSEEVVDKFVLFNSSSYNYLTSDNISIYNDHTDFSKGDKTVNEKGVFVFDDFKMSSYVLLGDNEFNKYSLDFYFYNIDNTEINFKNLSFVLFETIDNSEELLNENINKYIEQFKDESIDTRFTNNFDTISKNMFFVKGETLEDLNGKAKIASDGSFENRLIYHYTPFLSYNSSKSITQMNKCQFVIFELSYDENNNPFDAKVLTSGMIDNIPSTESKYRETHPNLLEGYSLGTLSALKKAGYNSYVWPIILKQTIICLVITSILGFMFYKTWSSDQKKKNIKK